MSSKASLANRRVAETSSRPSVSGMKSLLPLTLLSPTVSNNTNWPSSKTDQRPIFGDWLVPNNPWNLSHPSNIWTRHHKHDMHGLQTKVWTQQEFPPGFRHAQYYRDLPIYNEPGSPLGAYFTSRLPSLASSPPETAFSEEDQNDDELDERLRLAVPIRCSTKKCPDTLPSTDHTEELSEKSYVKTSRQCSDLSFQCFGEGVLDEGAWMRPRGRQKLYSSTLMPPLAEGRVESWISGTSVALEVDVLATATSLMPRKASLVETASPSPKKPPHPTAFPFPCSSSEFPPRVSSRGQLSVTPSLIPHLQMSEESDPSPMHPVSERTFDNLLPQRRLDIAMATPPTSPMEVPISPSSKGPSLPKVDDLGISMNGAAEEQDHASFVNISSEVPESDLISDLENEISAFPHMMPDVNSSLVAALQSRVSPKGSKVNIAGVDVNPLRRIFPDSTLEQRFALYVYILACIYLDLLLPTDSTTDYAISGGSKWRDTPLWGSSSPTRYNRRLRGVQSDLLRCIHSLMRRMEDPVGFEEGTCKSEYTVTTLRMLEEVVRCC